MRILDLFSGAGGAAYGYHLAFPDAEIVGVDINPQPNYPFTFVQSDAMTYPLDGFDFIHASPPCQDHSTASAGLQGSHGTGWMLKAAIDRLTEHGGPWIVENVEGAQMPSTVYSFRLCGSSFGLDVRRHRKFASSHLILPPPCAHGWQTPRFQSLNNKKRIAGELASVVGVHGSENYAGDYELRCKAMGINWMNLHELNQSIPPAYTRWIGEQFHALAQVA